jgi:hypothetical protein
MVLKLLYISVLYTLYDKQQQNFIFLSCHDFADMLQICKFKHKR